MKIWKIKISRTWTIIIAIILLFVGYSVVKSFFKDPLENYQTEKVAKGEIVQEVSETGSVRATKEVSLSFESIGRVSKINVSVGDNVKKGEILAELDSGQILAQLQSAKAAASAAKTQYEKLLNGLTPEDVQVYQNAVDSADNNLKSAYDSALNVLDSAYTKIYNASSAIDDLQYSYFTSSDQQGIKVIDSKNDIKSNMDDVKIYLDKARASKSREDINYAISQMILALDNVYNDLKIVREQCDQGTYYLSVPETDKATIDTHKSYINTASSSVISSQQSISSYKIALQTAQDNLKLKTVDPRSEDVDIYKSQIDQAQANVNMYQSQLNNNYIASPIDGKITEVNAKRGETISYSEPAVTLLSTEPFQIKVDVYEQDIVNVNPGDSVKIDLVAFPKETFEGRVLSIDPAERIVDNVVYYQVTIDFPNQPMGIRSGMTADIVIETEKKQDVLRVSKNAVESIDDKSIVQISNKGKIEDREIVIGLEGSDYYEVISGLNEGDIIITGTK